MSLPSLLFGLRPVLVPTGCWVGSCLGTNEPVVPLALASMVEEHLRYGCHQCPCPQGERQPPTASPGDPSRPVGRSGPGFYHIIAFPWVPVHVRFYVCPLRVKSLFPVLWVS